MAAFGRSSLFVVCFAALSTLLLQNMQHGPMLEGVPSGKTRVLDLSYAINDKLVPWPGDEKYFEAKVNASVEKNGYFTRSIWMRRRTFRRGRRRLTKSPRSNCSGRQW